MYGAPSRPTLTMRILPSRYPAALVARVTRAHVSEATQVSADAVSPVVEVVARDVDPRRAAPQLQLQPPAPEDGLRLLDAGTPAQRDAWLRLCAARGYGAQGASHPGDAPTPIRVGRLVDVTVA
jgi:hypothetical protein